MNAKEIVKKLKDFYCVNNLNDLAIKMNISLSTIKSWQTRNSISAIKTKCKDLRIYDKIFIISSIDEIDEEKIILIKNNLTNFNRRSRVCLSYILKQRAIKKYSDFLNFKQSKNEESKFKRFITLSILNYDNNTGDIVFANYLEELNTYLYSLLSEVDRNYLFTNKNSFLDFLDFLNRQK